MIYLHARDIVHILDISDVTPVSVRFPALNVRSMIKLILR
jgi:hypothetical protein